MIPPKQDHQCTDGLVFFLLRVLAGRDRRNFFGVGRDRAGQLVKSSGRGRVTVKLAVFSGRVEAVLIIFGAGAAIFPRAVAGWGGECIPGLIRCAPGRSGWPSYPHVSGGSH